MLITHCLYDHIHGFKIAATTTVMTSRNSSWVGGCPGRKVSFISTSSSLIFALILDLYTVRISLQTALRFHLQCSCQFNPPVRHSIVLGIGTVKGCPEYQSAFQEGPPVSIQCLGVTRATNEPHSSY